MNKISIGQEVKIRTGDNYLAGYIGTINPSVAEGVINFDVELNESHENILRPNMRVDVYVVLSKKDNIMRVRKGPFYNGSVDQGIFVMNGDAARKKTVDIGIANYDYVELIGQINQGDTVIISDMSRFKHVDEIEVE